MKNWDVHYAVPMYDPRNFENKKVQPEVPAERQRLAASLFGGSSNRKAANGTQVSKPAANLRTGEKSAPPRPVVAQPKQAPSPLLDLMDMSSGDSFPADPVANPSYDPFKELEGLLDAPSTAAGSTSTAPQRNSMDFMSLYDSASVVSHSTTPPTGDDDFLSLSHTSSSGMDALEGLQAGPMDLNELPAINPLGGLAGLVQPTSSSSTGLQERKGPSLQNSLQKDAASRHVGVTPTGANPALFQDLL